MSVKSKHSSKKESVVVKDKRKKLEDSDEDFETSEEELDLTKECHPIGHYMSDRAEMINQMFSVIKGNKLKAMLPPILKECDVEQLKLQCLDQLLGMSERRIACILEGEVLDTSSESDIAESDQCESDEKNGTTSVSSSKGSNASKDEELGTNADAKCKKRKKDVIGQPSRSGKLSKTESEPVEQGKTLLEILELEMRARAIRALLKQSGNEKGGEQGVEDSKVEVNGVKETTGEIVDLTECEDEETSGNAGKDLQEDKNSENRVLTFEDKIEKWRREKTNPPESDKSRRLQAELELRNKLFKKKIYRTRQQRMENEEEEKSSEKFPEEENNCSGVAEIVKQEPLEADQVVEEDPEEGELSTSEDEYPVEAKQESHEPTEESVREPVDRAMNEATEVNFEIKTDESVEIVTAIDSGTFVKGNSVEDTMGGCEVKEAEEHEESSVGDMKAEGEKEEGVAEETSWRDRWLRKDGVQKLVKSSKIYAKVKKRIAQKSQRAREDMPISYEANSDSNSNSKLEMIEGSIEEYERLLGRNVGPKNESSTKKRNENEPASEISENLKADKT